MNYISTFTNSLIGPALNYAVALANGWVQVRASEGLIWEDKDGSYGYKVAYYNPSDNWEMAGPIMDGENICAKPHVSPGDGKHFCACKWNDEGNTGYFPSVGKTQLIAAMRCYVASKLGDTVDIPEELL